jgi:hypothetical protein
VPQCQTFDLNSAWLERTEAPAFERYHGVLNNFLSSWWGGGYKKSGNVLFWRCGFFQDTALCAEPHGRVDHVHKSLHTGRFISHQALNETLTIP